MLAKFGLLEWIFVVLVAGMVGVAGLFGLFMIVQLFRNPGRRRP